MQISSVITNTSFYLNEHICVILLIEVFSKIQQETEAYSLSLSIEVKKTLDFFVSYSACLLSCSLFLSLSIPKRTVWSIND